MIYTRGRIRFSLRHPPLRSSHVRTVNFYRNMTNQATSTDAIDTKLHSILETKPSSVIFQFLIENHTRVDPKFSLTFTYNLLCQNNLQAAISLQHLLLTNANYQIPNELWSVLLDKVCSKLNYLGATFIFHELIDSQLFYDEMTLAVQENDQVPFVVNPNTLIHLAKIFTENGDAKRMEGILRYFRRFHSFLTNRETYKALLVLNVEVYAQIKDLTMALKTFKDLAFASKGLSNRKPLGLVRKNIAQHNQWRVGNIKLNQYRFDFIPTYPLDIHQQLLAQIRQSGIYNPVIQYNVYSSVNANSPVNGSAIAYTPMLLRLVDSTELPRFKQLFTEYIKLEEMYEHHKLIQLIRANHHSLHIFIVSALCELQKHELAFAVLKSLASYGQLLCKSPAFVTLLQSTKNEPKLLSLHAEIITFYRLLNKGHVNYPIAAYIHKIPV